MGRLAKEIQSDREDFAVDLFLDVYGRTHGKPRRPASDTPDFLVEIGGGLVGVELTETVDPKRREREELGFKIIGEAKRRYDDTGGPALYAWVLYEDMPIPRDPGIPDRIRRVIEAIRPEKLFVYEEHLVGSEELEAHGLPFIASIRVMRKPAGKTNTWGKTDAGTVLALSREDIDRIIRRKEGASATFLGDPGCKPWLVIYTFDDRVSGSADLAPEAAASSYSSRFEKVFVLDAARKGLVELINVLST